MSSLFSQQLEGDLPSTLLDCLRRRLLPRLDADSEAPGPRFEWLLLSWSP